MGVVYLDQTLEEMKLQSALKKRKILMIEEFTRESVYKAQYLINKIVDMDRVSPPKEKVITVEFSSYGGCAFSCLSFIGTIEKLKDEGYKIVTHINSMGMSAGFFTPIVGTHRTMNRHAVAMIHPMLGGTGGSLQTMIDDVEFDKKLWGRIADITMKYTKFTKEDLEELKRCKTDKHMFAEEMLAMGCIDEIL